MIAYEGRSPADVAKLFNAEKASGKATWRNVSMTLRQLRNEFSVAG